MGIWHGRLAGRWLGVSRSGSILGGPTCQAATETVAAATSRQAEASANNARSKRLFRQCPERWPIKRPDSGAPASARSPTASSSLWRANSSLHAQAARVQHARLSTTTALSRLPPCARPAARNWATSSARVKVRARAISFRKLSAVRCSDSACRPIAGAAKSIDSAISRPCMPRTVVGPSSAKASPSQTRTGRRISICVRGADCSTTPAQSSRKTKGAAEPSRAGDFRAVQFDARVVDPKGRQGSHQVLHRADLDRPPVRVADHGGEPGIDHAVEAGRNVAAKIGAVEHDAVPRLGRTELQADAAAAVQPHADAADRRLQRVLRAGRHPRGRRNDRNLRRAVHRVVLPRIWRGWQFCPRRESITKGRPRRLPVTDYCRMLPYKTLILLHSLRCSGGKQPVPVAGFTGARRQKRYNSEQPTRILPQHLPTSAITQAHQRNHAGRRLAGQDGDVA